MPRTQSRLQKTSLQQPKPLLKKIWENSQTIGLAYTQMGLAAVVELNNAINSPVISEPLNQLHLPSWFPYFLLLLGGLTYLAHGRKDA